MVYSGGFQGANPLLQYTAPAVQQQQPQSPVGYPMMVENPQKFYSRPQPTTPNQLYAAPAAPAQAQPASAMPMDASFNFGYHGEQSARQEEADSAGYVQGMYSYTNADGREVSAKDDDGHDHDHDH